MFDLRAEAERKYYESMSMPVQEIDQARKCLNSSVEIESRLFENSSAYRKYLKQLADRTHEACITFKEMS